ncbi:basic amino acid/polyamine antiporter [Mumia sp. zg.B21]|uniref:basic amino acid/polyamine antiporter n=1 Tax=unclassified Mumia TaxID=2621872 RepID=UPI001C6E4B05|nr:MULTISPECIES: basic amino acid/polyamine antiporter [unclassified Mumia]MBW9211045.1 basic amino acid/polyamine antiporter [Mumia sp. zg.B21]MDD9348236.1 basic amino acid/polyamine antiporter [Mumia sp.]
MVTREAAPGLQKVSVLTLTGLVVGSMVGGGVFTLPQEFGTAAGVIAAVIAWTIAGTGMMMLAFVFQSLAVRRPDLDTGMYSYAEAGFGSYLGFNAAFGYWASNVAGNVFFMVLTMATLGEFFPSLGDGTTVLAVAVASVVVWVFHALIAQGVRQAAVINRVVTAAKLVPILTFVVVVALAFDPTVFADNLWGGRTHTAGAVFEQVKSTMLVTTFVFLGVEGASVYSRLARRRGDVGRATVTGLLSVLGIFVAVTMVSYGVLPRGELADARQPSMGAVLESVVGGWGATFVSVGVVVSVQGAFLAWTLISAEILYTPARDQVMPRFLARTNEHATPILALLVTNLAVQALLLVSLVIENALSFMLKLDTALVLIPYLLAAAYALKLTVTRETYGAQDEPVRRRQQRIAVLAVLYALFLLYAAGVEYLLMACIVYAPGVVLYVVARREQHQRLFTRAEALCCAVLVAAAGVGVVLVATGELRL